MMNYGKSFFLRTGLMPLLEHPAAGFRFYTTDQGWFIRWTSRRLDSLADDLAEFVERGVEMEPPRGMRALSLRMAFPECATYLNSSEVLAGRKEVLRGLVRVNAIREIHS